MMNILRVTLSGPAWWWVRPTDKPIYPFNHRPGWALINPAFYQLIAEGQSSTKVVKFGGPEDSPETFVVCSNVICFESPCSFDALPKEFPFDEMPKLLRQLRYASRFARLPRSFSTLSVSEWDPTEISDIQVPEETKSGACSQLHVEALITEPKIESFTSMDADTLPPIHAEVLLDSIEAHSSSDFKKSILFAAVAAETLATTVLESEYQNIVENTSDHPRHRVVEIEVAGGERQRIDPIYQILVGSRNTPQIRRLMHEASLYVLGRSMMIEDKVLYDDILELFNKRNAIVHAGGAEVDARGFGNYRPIASAIRSVEKFFEWFGEPGPFPVLDQGVVLRGTTD